MDPITHAPPATGDVNIAEIAPQGIQTATSTATAGDKSEENVSDIGAGAGLGTT